MTDDPSLDLTAVAADDQALEALSASGARSDDPALDLLADLLADVGADLPVLVPVAVPQPLAAPRRLARSATAAVAAAAVLTMSGAAAAATSLAPAGTPLHGVREAVRAAAGVVADAVTPGRSTSPAPGPTSAAPTSTAPAPAATPSPRGADTSERTRSAAAAVAVRRLLDAADVLLDRQRPRQAQDRLEAADRRLDEVLAADGSAALRARLVTLKARADTALRPQTARPDAPQKGSSAEPAPQKPAKPARPQRSSSPQRESESSSGSESARRSARATSPDPTRSGAGAAIEQPRTDQPRSGRGQLSSTASVKPRA